MIKKIFTMPLLIVLVLCGCKNTIKEGSNIISCGSRESHIDWRITTKDNNTNRFAIVLAGSPVTHYFSDQGPQSKRLIDELVKRGFKVFEVKYPNGFYFSCRRQGIRNVIEHCSDLYNIAVENLEFNHNNQNHKLAGIGWSIGAIKLQAMAFMKNKRLDKTILIGTLLGNVNNGCQSFLDNKNDGYSWAEFHDLAAILTINGKGCYPKSEYGPELNFEKQPYFDKSSLAVFDGEMIRGSIKTGASPGNIDQARYIIEQRNLANAPAKLYSYHDCGHEVIECSKGKVVDDIIDFLKNI